MFPDHPVTMAAHWFARVAASPSADPTVAAAVGIAATNDGTSGWMYLLGGGSGVLILGMLGKAGHFLLSGAAKSEERREASLVLQRDTAWRERDDERKARLRVERKLERALGNTRRLWDHIADLRYRLTMKGVPLEQLPQPPALDNLDTEEG